MKHLLVAFLLFAFVTSVYCQNTITPNVIYFQLGGNGLFTSINYERQITRSPRFGTHVGAGIYGAMPSYLTIPFGVNYLFKFKNTMSSIDLGLGLTYTKADVSLYVLVDRRPPVLPNDKYINVVPSIGYRKQTRKNIMYRFSLTPIINQYGPLPFLGVSFGKSF